jgi:hypothetical protein
VPVTFLEIEYADGRKEGVTHKYWLNTAFILRFSNNGGLATIWYVYEQKCVQRDTLIPFEELLRRLVP